MKAVTKTSTDLPVPSKGALNPFPELLDLIYMLSRLIQDRICLNAKFLIVGRYLPKKEIFLCIWEHILEKNHIIANFALRSLPLLATAKITRDVIPMTSKYTLRIFINSNIAYRPYSCKYCSVKYYRKY